MDDKEWFKSLKEGDEVAALMHSRYYKSTYKTLKVSKVTPKGFVRLSNGDLLKSCEWHSQDRWSGSWYKIEPLTDDIRNKILEHNKRVKLIKEITSKLNDIDFNAISTDKLVELHKVCNELK